MKKQSLAILLGLILSINTVKSAFSDTKIDDKLIDIYGCSLLLNDNDRESIKSFWSDYQTYTNNHDLEGLKKLYAPQFISGDGFKQTDMLNLIKDAWKNYSDMKFSSDVKSIRINNGYATIESVDKSQATTSDKSELTGDNGIMNSEAYNIMYLKRFGNNWKIVTDRSLYEKTSIKYGTAKNTQMSFTAPEQVNAGEAYTASLSTEFPEENVAIGSIAKEPIVYPEIKPEDIFRPVPSDSGILERVMKANKTNNNELAVASVGFTTLSKAPLTGQPEVVLTGIALLIQRVNVIPKSTFIHPVEMLQAQEASAKTSDKDQKDED